MQGRGTEDVPYAVWRIGRAAIFGGKSSLEATSKGKCSHVDQTIPVVPWIKEFPRGRACRLSPFEQFEAFRHFSGGKFSLSSMGNHHSYLGGGYLLKAVKIQVFYPFYTTNNKQGVPKGKGRRKRTMAHQQAANAKGEGYTPDPTPCPSISWGACPT